MVADLRYLAVIVSLLSGCTAEFQEGTPRAFGELRHWDDVDAGVRCYRSVTFEDSSFACVKIR